MLAWLSPCRHHVAKGVTTSVGLTFGQMYPQAVTSCGPVCCYFGPDWHLVRQLGQVDLCSHVPLDTDILWPSVILLQVRLTLGQTFGSGSTLVRCTPLGKDILWPSVILLQVRLTYLLKGKSGTSSCSNSSSISIY